MAGTEPLLSLPGSTTESPLFKENQIIPMRSSATDRFRRTPSLPCKPSARPNCLTSVSVSWPRRRLSRVARNTWLVVVIQSDPLPSAIKPNICSCNDAGTIAGVRNRPESKKARPSSVPTHSKPVESSKRQFTRSDGNPSWTMKVFQRPFARALRPLGVANHMVPSRLSRMASIVFDTKPFLFE